MNYKIEILKETKDYLAVYKPAGLPVETKDPFMQDLEGIVTKQILPSGKRDGGEGFPLKAVNRLDLPVEGIVLLARNRKAAAELSGQIRERESRKIYYAIVEGKPNRPEGRLRNFLKKAPAANITEVVEEGTPGAREALLDYRVLSTRQNISLLKICLHTGRHHQIRVQLAHAGMPILGDVKYGTSAGAYAGISAGTFEGAVSGISAGTSEGAVAGISAGAFEGAVAGISAGTFEGAVAGISAGTSEGAFTGTSDGAADKISDSTKSRSSETGKTGAAEEGTRTRRFLRRGSRTVMPIAEDRKSAAEDKVFPALCAAELSFKDPGNGKEVKISIRPRGKAFEIFCDILSEVQVIN